MERTYVFVFDPEPEGGFTVICPAIPGLVTCGETMEEARLMAREALEALVGLMMDEGEVVPPSDPPETLERFRRLAFTLRDDDDRIPVMEAMDATFGSRNIVSAVR